MIRLFRNIRQNLLTDKSYATYLLYASGEIALVIVGILLALQIDNWNDNRKQAEKEIEMLQEFRSNLETNIRLLESNIALSKNLRTVYRVIDESLENRVPLTDSLRAYFQAQRGILVQPDFVTTAYTSMMTTGFELITSDTIRTGIIHLYENIYKFLDGIFDHDIHYQILAPFIIKYFYTERSTDKEGKLMKRLVPSDYEKLLDDQEYRNLISWLFDLADWSIELKSNAILETQQVIDLIDKELKN